MASSPLRPHLHPREIARRQRWVAVGVTILTLLLIITWVTTLPARISQSTGAHSGWRAIFGEMPKGTLIDSDSLINSPARQQQDAALLQAVSQALTTAPAATSTSAAAAEATTTTPVTPATPTTAATTTVKK